MGVELYGLINEAMRRLVSEQAGASAWSRIAARAETAETFVGLLYYDDEVTYRLVAAASAELDSPADELLRAFGHYWSARVGPENYRDILGATGTSVMTVLANMDLMHARIQNLYPELVPPSFSVSDTFDGGIMVEYRSHREGLAPFVVGLLEGLGDLYDTPTTVTYEKPRSAEQPFDLFRVQIGG